MKSNKKNWFIVKSIRFDPIKIKKAKELKVLNQLPDLCRNELDKLINKKETK